MPQPLTDEELESYSAHADAHCDAPLAALVAELRDRRMADAWRPWAIVVLAAEQAPLLGPIIAAGGPRLLIAPEGLRLPRLQVRSSKLSLETYDPQAPLELRRILQAYGIGGSWPEP
jgi:hypothetical protein